MTKTSLFSFIFILSQVAWAEKPISLNDIRELITNKKIGDAVQILKKEKTRLLKTDKAQKDVAAWFSVFVFEASQELYDRAQMLSATDPSGAKEAFEALLEKEPYNKTAITAYASFLINLKKWKEAATIIEKAQEDLPYFPIFSAYRIFINLGAEESAMIATCDRRTMTSHELELCQLANFMLRVTNHGRAKKISEAEFKGLLVKSQIPEMHYWMWVETKNLTHLKNYVSLCKNMTEKTKKNYRNVPALCAKMQEAESQTEPKKNEEPNAS